MPDAPNKSLEPIVMTVKEACVVTTLSERFIRQAIADGHLRALKVGSRRLITRAALEKWLTAYGDWTRP